MTLYKRDNVWWVQFHANGKRFRMSTHTANKEIAKVWARQIETARNMPSFDEAVKVLRMFYDKPEEGVIGLDAAWDVYVKLAKATGKDNVEDSTLTRRRNTLKRFTDWVEKCRPNVSTVEDVTGPVAAGFATFISEQKLKSKTRINIIAELGTVWKMLENASVGVRNPWASLRPQDTDGECGKAFSLEQEQSVLEAARKVGKQWFEICTIMRHTGLRYEDVATMTWSEIQGDVIRLNPKKTRRHFISVGIPIIAPIRKVLDGMVRSGDVMFPLHEELYEKNSTRFKKLNFKEVLVEAGLDGQGFTVHSWRHTAATRLAESGADIETRKQILGHTVDATARRYDHDEHLLENKKALNRAAKIK